MRKNKREKIIKVLKKIITRLERNDIKEQEIVQLTLEEINPEDVGRGMYSFRSEE